MTGQEFDRVVREVFQTCLETLIEKSKGYAGGDREKLHNFMVIARRKGISPEQAALFLAEKHMVALEDWINDLASARIMRAIPEWEEKIVDIINYHVLVYALLRERATEAGR